MAFQDSAESLAEKLHLSRVPRPVFAAIALVLALVVALAVFAFATSPGSGFEVTAASDELRRGASASMWTAAWRRRASTIWRRAVAS